MSNSSISYNVVSGSSSGGGSNSIQDFRLTLASNTPVMTTAVTAATTLYLTPYTGNKIALYNGSSWDVIESNEVNIGLSTVAADTNYDVFAYNNSGTVALELLAWTSSGAGTSARATALAYQNGVLVKSGTTTRRYVGTIRGSASGQCQYSFGSSAVGGGEAKLFVWNYYNRVLVSSLVATSTLSWTYVPPVNYAFRAAQGSSAFRASFVCGVPEDSVGAKYLIYAYTSAGNVIIGLGLNSTSAPTQTSSLSSNTVNYQTLNCALNRVPSTGFNFVSALDGGWGTTNTAYYLANYDTGVSANQTGLQFTFMM